MDNDGNPIISNTHQMMMPTTTTIVSERTTTSPLPMLMTYNNQCWWPCQHDNNVNPTAQPYNNRDMPVHSCPPHLPLDFGYKYCLDYYEQPPWPHRPTQPLQCLGWRQQKGPTMDNGVPSPSMQTDRPPSVTTRQWQRTTNAHGGDQWWWCNVVKDVWVTSAVTMGMHRYYNPFGDHYVYS